MVLDRPIPFTWGMKRCRESNERPRMLTRLPKKPSVVTASGKPQARLIRVDPQSLTAAHWKPHKGIRQTDPGSQRLRSPSIPRTAPRLKTSTPSRASILATIQCLGRRTNLVDVRNRTIVFWFPTIRYASHPTPVPACDHPHRPPICTGTGCASLPTLQREDPGRSDLHGMRGKAKGRLQ
jgi:hypothetical protein